MNRQIYPHWTDVKKTFAVGSVLGILVFIVTYGVKILDFRYDAWLLNPSDLAQHYLGWCLYRSSPWTFPVGLTPNYAWPLEVSAMYADVIPICAVFFKIFSPLLPEVFQYFGLWGLFCYAMQGGIGAILLRRFISSNWWSGVFSLFFIVGSQIMYRMYMHTALGTQWIILLVLCFLFYGDNQSNSKLTGHPRCPHALTRTLSSRCAFGLRSLSVHSKKWVVIWGLMGSLCVWVHGYFVPMVFLVMLAWLYRYWWRQRRKTDCIYALCSYLINVAISMWILGAFSVAFATIPIDLGRYGANLDTFFNPVMPVYSKLMHSFIIPDGQYEGWSYLGVGGLGLLLIAIIKSGADYYKEKALDVVYFPPIVLFLICFCLAVMPQIYYHENVLLAVHYPHFINSLLSIFRANGRFIWISAYLLMLFSIVKVTRVGSSKFVTASIFNRCMLKANSYLHCSVGIVIVTVMLVIQCVDFSEYVKYIHRGFADGVVPYNQAVHSYEKHDFIDKNRTIMSGYEEVDKIMKHYKYVCYTDYHYVNNNVDNAVKAMMISYYAHKNNVKLEAFYLARMPEKHLQEEQEKILQELKEGIPRENVLYVIADRGAVNDYKGLFYHEVNGVLLGSKKSFE